MELIKKNKFLFVALLTIGTFFYFGVRSYLHDVQVLTEFSLYYKEFDDSINDLSKAILNPDSEGHIFSGSLLQKTNRSFSEIESRSSERISSLIKNDAEFMKLELEIITLSRKELMLVENYTNSKSSQTGNIDLMIKELRELQRKRKEAFVQFQHLVELTK